LMQLEEKIKAVPAPSDAEVEQYYKSNPDKFTEPKRENLSILLLPVAPWAEGEEWKQAESNAEALHEQIQSGVDFAELARELSADPSASQGGALGYIHGGMLAGDVQKAIDELEVGETTKPVETLQGMALFKLHDRIVPALRSFDSVKERARRLCQRQKKDDAWNNFQQGLRDASEIEIFDELLNKDMAASEDQQDVASKQDPVDADK